MQSLKYAPKPSSLHKLSTFQAPKLSILQAPKQSSSQILKTWYIHSIYTWLCSLCMIGIWIILVYFNFLNPNAGTDVGGALMPSLYSATTLKRSSSTTCPQLRRSILYYGSLLLYHISVMPFFATYIDIHSLITQKVSSTIGSITCTGFGISKR